MDAFRSHHIANYNDFPEAIKEATANYPGIFKTEEDVIEYLICIQKRYAVVAGSIWIFAGIFLVLSGLVLWFQELKSPLEALWDVLKYYIAVGLIWYITMLRVMIKYNTKSDYHLKLIYIQSLAPYHSALVGFIWGNGVFSNYVLAFSTALSGYMIGWIMERVFPGKPYFTW